ncbi:MAG TPA: hypothetical protein ENJ00_11365 [Phycisphaerales bacterium]|nr:hypothetical protein [Phycisphaerales bacterium]
MKPRKTTYLAHRWIGLVIALQLLAWSTGGFIFSVLDIDSVRGTTDSRMRDVLPIRADSRAALPRPLQDVLDALGDVDIGSVMLIDRGLGIHWEIRDTQKNILARADISGASVGLISPDEAGHLALSDFRPQADVKSVKLLESDPPSEYRGGPLPAYRVDLQHAKQPHIYIEASTGRITARRNRSWRLFDFFWMLHTMDYKGRDNFNHPLLIVASALAIATSGTGIALWGWRISTKIRRRG